MNFLAVWIHLFDAIGVVHLAHPYVLGDKWPYVPDQIFEIIRVQHGLNKHSCNETSVTDILQTSFSFFIARRVRFPKREDLVILRRDGEHELNLIIVVIAEFLIDCLDTFKMRLAGNIDFIARLQEIA